MEFTIIALFHNDYRIYELGQTINIDTGRPSGFCFTRSVKTLRAGIGIAEDVLSKSLERRFKVFPTIRLAMINASGNEDDHLSFGYYGGFRTFTINGHIPDNLDFLKFI